MARIDIRISGSTQAAHIDAQNAVLAHLQHSATGLYALCSPKGSWDGETRVLHLTSDQASLVSSCVGAVDPAGCTVEVIDLDAPTAASESETAPVGTEVPARRGRKRKA